MKKLQGNGATETQSGLCYRFKASVKEEDVLVCLEPRAG